MSAASAVVSGNVDASWASRSSSSFLVSSLGASTATIVNSDGMTVGTGSVTATSSVSSAVSVSGSNPYSVQGQGNLSFYGPAESNLGVGGNWDSYTATVRGNVSITLTTDGLTLNGQALPAGTYTITTNSATLSGSGTTSSPNFAGSASITAPGGTINLGPGSGNLSVGGNAARSRQTKQLWTATTECISVSANGGNGTDSVTLNGNAANVLSVAVSPVTFTTDQNTPITFQPNIQTSLADTYNLTAQRPAGLDGLDRQQRQRHRYSRPWSPGRDVSDPGHRAIEQRSEPGRTNHRRSHHHTDATRHDVRRQP